MMPPLKSAVAAVALLAGLAPAASAQSGPLVVNNRTGTEVTVTNLKYVDPAGNTTAPGLEWPLKAGFDGYLVVGPGQGKMVARRVVFDLVTADGRSKDWACDCKVVAADGAFVVDLTADTLAAHRRLLGVAPPVVARFGPPAAPPPPAGRREQVQKDLTQADANAEFYRVRANELTVKTLAAAGAVALAERQADQAKTPGGQFAAGFAVGLAREVYRDLLADLQRTEAALRDARGEAARLRAELNSLAN